jgi:hypothetical protein
MSAAVNFHRRGCRFDSANFAHRIRQCLDVINAWLQGFWIWCESNYIPTPRRSHASCVIFA